MSKYANNFELRVHNFDSFRIEMILPIHEIPIEVCEHQAICIILIVREGVKHYPAF